jgi:crotonobetainyl-CoA:carnitine CoA-transferase CaiB-like acyl-CoA transferase
MDVNPKSASTGPLAGHLVLDLTRALAGPQAAMMLGDLGARVIKVENPDGGDDTRGWGPPFAGPQDDPQSTYFLAANRNKESITLDLKSPADTEVLTKLVERADVLMENFRTGTLDRLGFSAERLLELNPRLVILSITGFGHDGPEGGRAGYDQIAQGEGGLMSLTGSGPDDPQRVGVPIADLLSGLFGTYGVLGALMERERTGRGQVVRTSLLAAMVGVHAFQGTKWTVAGQVGLAQGNHHPSIAPYGLFRARNGAVQIAVGSDGLWRRFCGLTGIDPETPGWSSNSDRVRDRDGLIEAIEVVFGSWDADELLDALDRAGVPAGRVRNLQQVYEWGQTQSQGLVVEVDHAVLGSISLPGPAVRFFGSDGVETSRSVHGAPPTLGQHSDLIRGEVESW